MENNKLYEDVSNYTKFKVAEMIIEKYKDKKLDNLNLIEELSENVLKTLAICGLKFHTELHKEFGDES